MKRFFECVLVTFCYWLAMFIGPAIVLLWNNFSYYVSGLGYGPESLMYKVLTFFSQPLSCLLAVAIARSIGKEKHNLCILVNCVAAACFCGSLVLVYTFFVYNSMQFWVMAVSTIACIIAAVMQAKELEPAKSVTENELERYKAENEKLTSTLNKQKNIMYVLNLVAEKAGMSIEEIVDAIYVTFLKSCGYSETDAKAQLQAKKQEYSN